MINQKSEWSKIISCLEGKKPMYGNLTIELTFHQNLIKKAKILKQEDLIIFEKDKNTNNKEIKDD